MTTRLIRPLAALAMSVCLATPTQAQEPMRMLGAHEHGHGTLNLAIEGNKVLIELRAPGDDIVGFEHPAHSVEDKAALEKAQATLKAPLTLFTLPSEADCRLDSATVELAGESKLEHENGHEKDGQDAKEKHEDHEGHEGHKEFHAEYALTCAHPRAIRHLAFPFFVQFPRSRELDVTVLSADGQMVYEVERDRPAIDLKRAP